MRVDLVTGSISDGTTGLSRYASTLFRELTHQDVDVHFADLRVPFEPILTFLERRFSLDPIAFFSTYPVAVQRQEADIYHLTSESLASLLMFQRLPPVVVTVHAFFTYFLRRDSELAISNHIYDRAFDALAARGLHRADAIIAVSNYVANLLMAELGIPSERIHVIPEAVDHDFFRPLYVPSAFRTQYGLESDYFYFLYVGSEQPRKNFPALLRAFSRVRAENDRVRLLKVGAPELRRERKRAIALIQSLGIEQDVKFLGHVGSELPLFYNVSDALVFPSLYEGFGFPPLEAMACGTATICSNSTSLPEVVGDAALLVDPQDEDALFEAMRLFTRDDRLRHRYEVEGLARSKRFCWREQTQKTVALYRHMLN